ncbi:MAG: NAD(P)-dependent oxidoreductase [Verrucomicrobiaceae bacterium]|jgi:dTDP-glucose 4,6-dehydratase|nr:NAD(P)-dependent oxidoreductase [Verrucomicrobiaceae bacterium]
MTALKLPIEDLEHVLTHTRNIWEEARGQQIFITGGTGFFGRWLLETFAYINERLSLEASATVLTRDPEAFKAKAPHLASCTFLNFIRGDIRDFSFPEGEYLFIIHAGTTSSTPVEPYEMFDTIVQGTRRVVDFAVNCKAQKFLYVSSGAVYGGQPSELTHVPESYLGAVDSLQPGAAYARGKQAAEMLCCLNSLQNGYEVKIARCFAFVGPHLPLDSHFAVGNFIRDALRGGPIHIQGDGTPHRSYLYAADLAIWLWTLLFRGQKSHAYNVGSHHSLSIADTAHVVSAAIGGSIPINIAQAARGDATMRYVPDTTLAETELGLHSHILLDAAVRRTVSWLNPKVVS